MNTLNADPQMAEALRQAHGLTEIRDTAGRIIGYYAPLGHPGAPASVSVASHVDREELRRRHLSTARGAPTAEVLARLDQLDAECNRRQNEGQPPLTSDEVVDWIRAARSRPATP
jgi:hypothetical protein